MFLNNCPKAGSNTCFVWAYYPHVQWKNFLVFGRKIRGNGQEHVPQIRITLSVRVSLTQLLKPFI